VTGVELECSYGAGDGWTRSGVASTPKERSGGPRLDRSCDWEKYGYDTIPSCCNTRPRDLNCRVATSCIDSSQHSVLSLKFSTIVLQHPILTALQDFSIQLNHCCNTSTQPATLQYSGSTTMLQHPVCIAILCLDSAQPPCCNT